MLSFDTYLRFCDALSADVDIGSITPAIYPHPSFSTVKFLDDVVETG